MIKEIFDPIFAPYRREIGENIEKYENDVKTKKSFPERQKVNKQCIANIFRLFLTSYLS